MHPLFDQVDRAPSIKRFLKWLSTWLAVRRGLPILAAVGLTVLSLLVHWLIALVPGSVLLNLCGFTLLHLAILIGFLGVLLAEPLGKG